MRRQSMSWITENIKYLDECRLSDSSAPKTISGAPVFLCPYGNSFPPQTHHRRTESLDTFMVGSSSSHNTERKNQSQTSVSDAAQRKRAMTDAGSKRKGNAKGPSASSASDEWASALEEVTSLEQRRKQEKREGKRRARV